MTNWQLYILKCRDGSYYTGITTDLKRRLDQHNAGTGSKYTRSRRPVKLAYCERQASESSARKREHQIKRWTRAKKAALVKTASFAS